MPKWDARLLPYRRAGASTLGWRRWSSTGNAQVIGRGVHVEGGAEENRTSKWEELLKRSAC